MIVTTDNGGIRELRLNRPPVNALTSELMIALREAIQGAERDAVRALILAGSPGRFSAGLDVPLLLGLQPDEIAQLWRELYALLQVIAASPVPIVAAITGHAPAGGTVLALFCDYRIMAQGDFKLGLNEVAVGIPLPPVILGGLRRLVGARQAERLGVSGALLSPEQALAVGLVDDLAPAEQIAERARNWCMQMLALPHEAMTATRRQARADLVDLFGSGLGSELERVIESWWSPSTQSTLRALVDRLKKKTG
jgi:enoyl-CoA hydratase/carnithine racemase